MNAFNLFISGRLEFIDVDGRVTQYAGRPTDGGTDLWIQVNTFHIKKFPIHICCFLFHIGEIEFKCVKWCVAGAAPGGSSNMSAAVSLW